MLKTNTNTKLKPKYEIYLIKFNSFCLNISVNKIYDINISNLTNYNSFGEIEKSCIIKIHKLTEILILIKYIWNLYFPKIACQKIFLVKIPRKK